MYSHEVEQINKLLDRIYREADFAGGPKLTYIIVSKRINTRIFTGEQNPKPGTVVDDVITLPERLISCKYIISTI